MSKLKRKYLKKEEMLNIDLLNCEVREFDHMINKINLQAELLKAEIEKKQYEARDLMRRKNIKQESLIKFMDEIKKLCGVKSSKMGFDPQSGEIKL